MAGAGKLVRLARNVKQTGRSARAKKQRDELRKQLKEEELSGTGPKLKQKPAPKPKKKVPKSVSDPYVAKVKRSIEKKHRDKYTKGDSYRARKEYDDLYGNWLRDNPDAFEPY